MHWCCLKLGFRGPTNCRGCWPTHVLSVSLSLSISLALSLSVAEQWSSLQEASRARVRPRGVGREETWRELYALLLLLLLRRGRRWWPTKSWDAHASKWVARIARRFYWSVAIENKPHTHSAGGRAHAHQTHIGLRTCNTRVSQTYVSTPACSHAWVSLLPPAAASTKNTWRRLLPRRMSFFYYQLRYVSTENSS